MSKHSEVTGAPRISRRKKIVAVTVAVVGIAGAAFAYWTGGGSGTGSATTGDQQALTVVQTSSVTGLAPGVLPKTLSGNFDNPNTGPVFITSVTASIASVTKADGAPDGTCDASDYTLVGATMPVAAQVPAGDGQGGWTGATLAFNNKPLVNQDACKGATVNLAYTAS